MRSGVSQRCWRFEEYGLASPSRSRRTAAANPAQKETNETVGIGFAPTGSSTGCRHPEQGSPGLWADDETLKWLVPLTATQPGACRWTSHLLGMSSTPTSTRSLSFPSKLLPTKRLLI